MAFGNTPKDAGNIPIASVYNTANNNFPALQSGPETTDGTSNLYAPAAMYIYDGNAETIGAKADAAASSDSATATFMSLFKRLLAKFPVIGQTTKAGSVSVTVASDQFNDVTMTGTLTAAQPTIGTTVTGGTITLTLGQGQASWQAYLTAATTFTSSTTIMVDKSIDGTNWTGSNFRVANVSPSTPTQTVAGGSATALSGTAAGLAAIRVRCSALGSGDQVTVTIRSNTGVGEVALLSSIPTGVNSIGTVVTNADTTLNSTTAPAKGLIIGGKTTDGTPQYQPLPLSAGGAAVNVSHTAAASVSGTLQSAQTAAGNGTPLSILGMNTTAFTLSGTYTQITANFEGTEDGTNWSPLFATQLGTNTTSTTAITTNTIYVSSCSGLQQVRARTTVGGSPTGSMTVTAHSVPLSIPGATVALYGTQTTPGDTAIVATSIGAIKTALVGGTNLIGSVNGPVASGATNANNPLKTGGVFNTTQPTVTTGQIVDGQATNRGAAIVATGVDTFHTTVDNTTSLGQAPMASSLPVVVASDQSNVPTNMMKVNGATLALGQTTMAASLPVAVASDQGNVPVKSARTEIAGQGTGVVNAVNADLIPSQDVTGYTVAVLQLTGSWTATFQAQQSNDNAAFLQTQLLNGQLLIIATGTKTTITANGLYIIPLVGHYLRVRATGFTNNTSLVGTLELYSTPPPFVMAAMATNFALAPQTSGGTIDYHLISAATTNANSIKSSAGQVYGYELGNNGASDAYIKLYNKASSPTVGTDTPLRSIYVPKGARSSFHTPIGIAFGTGIAVAITGGAADSDTTAVAVSQVTCEVDYN